MTRCYQCWQKASWQLDSFWPRPLLHEFEWHSFPIKIKSHPQPDSTWCIHAPSYHLNNCPKPTTSFPWVIFWEVKKWMWNKGYFSAVSHFLLRGGLIEPISASLLVLITLQNPQTVWNQWHPKNHPMLIFGVKIYWQYLSLIQSHEVKKQAFAISCKVKHLIHHPWITMMYSSYRAVQAQEEDETYLMEDNHQSATIPVHHRQQTNKQKHRYLMGGTDHFSVSVT